MIPEAMGWYAQSLSKYNILPNCVNREIFFKEPVLKKYLRPFTLSSIKGLGYIMDRISFASRQYHFFRSVATLDLKQVPQSPSRLEELSEFRKVFNAKFYDMMTGYDLVIDVDAEQIQEAFGAAWKLKDVYDRFKLPYYLIYSGSKGFHLTIEWQDIQAAIETTPTGFVKMAQAIIKGLSKETGLKYEKGGSLDTIYDNRRVIRVPYSIHPTTNRVCLPLSDQDFESFKEKKCEIKHVLNSVKLFNRGNLKRPNSAQNIKGFVECYA